LTVTRRNTLAARRAGIPPKPSIAEYSYTRGTAALPLADLTEDDRARLAVREARRKVFGEAQSAHDLVTLPGVHGLDAAIRFIDGGRDRFLEFVQLAVLNNEMVACKWWDVYRELPPYPRKMVSFDDVCAGAGVRPADLMSVVVSTAMTIGMDAGNLVMAAMHPQVIAAHVKSAERIDGDLAELSQRDRFMFLQGRGLAPVPKGTTVHVHANASASAKAAAAASAEPTVPSFTDDMASLSSARGAVQRQLIEREIVIDLPGDASEAILIGEGD